MDMDNIENNKFWKDIARITVTGLVVIVLAWLASKEMESRRMVALGYEYRKVATEKLMGYDYRWVRPGSAEVIK